MLYSMKMHVIPIPSLLTQQLFTIFLIWFYQILLFQFLIIYPLFSILQLIMHKNPDPTHDASENLDPPTPNVDEPVSIQIPLPSLVPKLISSQDVPVSRRSTPVINPFLI
ncbi:hypothetical protein Dimus_026388 [Dionaea muscipula]